MYSQELRKRKDNMLDPITLKLNVEFAHFGGRSEDINEDISTNSVMPENGWSS